MVALRTRLIQDSKTLFQIKFLLFTVLNFIFIDDERSKVQNV